MTKYIVTQDGIIINFSKLLAVFVDVELDDNENVIGYNLVGVTSVDENYDSLLLGTYDDEESADNAKADIIEWLQCEAFSTFEMPVSTNGGNA